MFIDPTRYARGEPSNHPDDATYYDNDPDGRPTIHAAGFVWRLIVWPVVAPTTAFVRFLEERDEKTKG